MTTPFNEYIATRNYDLTIEYNAAADAWAACERHMRMKLQHQKNKIIDTLEGNIKCLELDLKRIRHSLYNDD